MANYLRMFGNFYLTRTSSLLALGILLTACAGGGEGERESQSNSQSGIGPREFDAWGHVRGRGEHPRSQVFIVRHAEEPESGPHLNERGRLRASLLRSWFAENSDVLTGGLPELVVAASPLRQGRSERSLETCEPYAAAVDIEMVDSYSKGDEEEVAQFLKQQRERNGKSSLICWQHSHIPDLVEELGIDDAPSSWDDDVFDRIWVVNFEGHHPVSFQNLPQKLLPGDATF